jgi:hypothetical protein
MELLRHDEVTGDNRIVPGSHLLKDIQEEVQGVLKFRNSAAGNT